LKAVGAWIILVIVPEDLELREGTAEREYRLRVSEHAWVFAKSRTPETTTSPNPISTVIG
jgi:hypothetical protein